MNIILLWTVPAAIRSVNTVLGSRALPKWVPHRPWPAGRSLLTPDRRVGKEEDDPALCKAPRSRFPEAGPQGTQAAPQGVTGSAGRARLAVWGEAVQGEAHAPAAGSGRLPGHLGVF